MNDKCTFSKTSPISAISNEDSIQFINKSMVDMSVQEKENVKNSKTYLNKSDSIIKQYSNTPNIDYIIKKVCTKLNDVIDNWCENHCKHYSGGKMRGDRGEHIEKFVTDVINMFKDTYGVNVYCIKGSFDKKTLTLTKKECNYIKEHQVDIHIYKDELFIAVIECKAYLDSCYYTRACDDFKLFRKYGYDVKTYIFALENSISEKTKNFIDHENDYVCDDIFYMLDGKRSSTKPVYDAKYRKHVNRDKMTYFIDSLRKLLL